MASDPSAVWALTSPSGMSRWPAPGSSALASRSRVRTTRTTARTSRIAEMTFGDTGSLWPIRGGGVRTVHFVTLGAVVELGGQSVDQRVDLAGPVPPEHGVEPQPAQVVPRHGPVDREAYVAAVVVRRTEGGAATGSDHRHRPDDQHDQRREEPGHGALTAPRPRRP